MTAIIIAGPSGVGKSLLCDELEKKGIAVLKVITDCPQRYGEIAPKDRAFLSKENFTKKINDFVYWFEYLGNRYGYSSVDISGYFSQGKSISLNTFPEHIKPLAAAIENSIIIYLHCERDDFKLLRMRMKNRNVSGDEIESRLQHAGEMAKEFKKIQKVLKKFPGSKAFRIYDDKVLYRNVIPYISEVLTDHSPQTY